MVKWTDFLLPAAIVGGVLLLYRGVSATASDLFSAFGIGGSKTDLFDGGNGDGVSPTVPDVIRGTGRAVGLGLFEAGAGAAGGIFAIRAARRIPFRLPSFVRSIGGRFATGRGLLTGPLGILALYPAFPPGGERAPGGGTLYTRTTTGRMVIARTYADLATGGRIPFTIGQEQLL